MQRDITKIRMIEKVNPCLFEVIGMKSNIKANDTTLTFLFQ